MTSEIKMEEYLPELTQQLDFLFDNESTIITLACLRIDNHPPLYSRTRHQLKLKNFEARLIATCEILYSAGSELIHLAGDTHLRTIAIRTQKSHVAVRYTDLLIILVETSLLGNAKGIANQINVLWQEERSSG